MGDLSKNFSRWEFASKDGAPGYDTVDAELLRILQELRDFYGEPITILSGHRSPNHNRRVGGAKNSQHLYGRAADISVEGRAPKEVADHVWKSFPRVSVGRYETFTHIDTRSGKRTTWNG